MHATTGAVLTPAWPMNVHAILCPAGGVMFFLGILLSVEALNAAGLLQLLAAELNQAVPDVNVIAAAIGLASAVIDNVSRVVLGAHELNMAASAAIGTHKSLAHLLSCRRLLSGVSRELGQDITHNVGCQEHLELAHSNVLSSKACCATAQCCMFRTSCDHHTQCC